MTRILASKHRSLIINVVGQSVVIRSANGRPTTRTFRNRYTLRKFVDAQMAKPGFVSVNR
jgi:hypothetical protein